MDSDDIVVLIPAYNEATTIRAVVTAALSCVKKVIVVDDGSTDETAQQLLNLPITILQNPTNQGKAAALLRGFSYALNMNATAIITLDADTQHNPCDIPLFLSAQAQYPNHILIGARLLQTEQAPKARLRANKVANFFISWAAGEKIYDTQSGFRLYPIQFIQHCVHQLNAQDGFAFESELLIEGVHNGFHTAAITIASHYPEGARSSHYRPLRDTLRIAKVISWRLLIKGFNIPGLIRALCQSGTKIDGNR